MTTLDASSGGDAALDADGFVLAAKDEAASPSRARPARGGGSVHRGRLPAGASPASSSRALVVSRFFARPASASAAAEAMMPPWARAGSAWLCPRDSWTPSRRRVALAQFVEVARKKSAHDAHEDAAGGPHPVPPLRASARRRAVGGEGRGRPVRGRGRRRGGPRAELDAGPAPPRHPPGADPRRGR